MDAGIPAQDTERVAAILSESKNLFAAYNGLTKAFGRKQGKEFYRLIKEHFASVPSDESLTAPAENSEPIQLAITEMTAVEGETEEEPKKTEEQEAKEQSDKATEQSVEAPPGSLNDFLVEKGLSAEAADQIASIVASTPNLRVGYNVLRKAFGAIQGREYLALVKEFKNQK